MSITDTGTVEMPEPPDGSYVMIGVSPDEAVYARTDDGDDPHRWWALADDSPHLEPALTWAQILGFEGPVQRMWPGVDLWVGLYRHLDDAHNAAQDPAFVDGLRFAAALVADMLGLARPPWA